MSEALLIMTEKSFGCVGILDQQGLLTGIITDGDLRRHMGTDLIEKKARDVMTPTPKTIRAKALIAEAIAFMNSNKVTTLFVTEEGEHPSNKTNKLLKPIGIINMHSCLRAS